MECETAEYDRQKLILTRDQITRTPETICSAYYRSELEDSLPEQDLLLDRPHKGLYLKLDNKPKAKKE